MSYSYTLDIGDGKSIVIYDEPSEKWAGDFIRQLLADATSLAAALDVIECHILAIEDGEDRACAGRMFAHLRNYRAMKPTGFDPES